MNKKCENCMYFVNGAICHRYPPQAICKIVHSVYEAEFAFPRVSSISFCGEFKEKEIIKNE